MELIGMEYRKTESRYWWLLGMFTLIGGMIGIIPIIIALSFNPDVRAADHPQILLGLILMGWRFGFLPSVLTWAVLFILGLKRSTIGTVITTATGLVTAILNGWLIYELSFKQGLLAGLCGAFAAFILSLCLPKPRARRQS
ncbi:MAG: hypothetical protein Q4A84_07375 [Neisseria sp.]|uniref:hypothetical protein n=1 Tax=Neisseria sp. TaxID=192066 RepID=UPI0026DAFEBA|nr:hypothetical protein [Neisseria sp.]MDO4641504.1 hypothetical protein [Neisseria sp.]